MHEISSGHPLILRASDAGKACTSIKGCGCSSVQLRKPSQLSSNTSPVMQTAGMHGKQLNEGMANAIRLQKRTVA